LAVACISHEEIRPSEEGLSFSFSVVFFFFVFLVKGVDVFEDSSVLEEWSAGWLFVVFTQNFALAFGNFESGA
jgi:hypothetical protein